MRMRIYAAVVTLWCLGGSVLGQSSDLSKEVKKYIKVDAPKVVLAHVRVVDGTGAPAVEDQNVVIAGGKITAVEKGADMNAIGGVTLLDLRGYTVMPGIVGMHNHLYTGVRPNLDFEENQEGPVLAQQMTFSAPRLYLAAGVTTMRTTGSMNPYADLNLKHAIEAGTLPGPHMDVTGPFLEGAPAAHIIEQHELSGPDEARQMVEYWADRGATSFKAYVHITRAELKAATAAAHERGLKITGHLCSVTYLEAAELGIDDLEHGFFYNSQLIPDKKADECKPTSILYTLEHMDPHGPEANHLIDILVKHHVAVTSTLPVQENRIANRVPLRQAVLDAMSPDAREAYLIARNRAANPAPQHDFEMLLKREMELERAFVAAGGLLMTGPDSSLYRGNIPGFGDQRGIELLVEAGFSPTEAIKIATMNGAIYLGRQDQIGSIVAGKNADLALIKGNPATRISDIENVEIVFKDGVGYDSQKLLDSVKGHYGQY